MTERRVRHTPSDRRALILDATEEILLGEGYAAVSSRKVAAAAGIKPSLLHYYFTTLDDLFVAVFRRRADQTVERIGRLVASQRPLQGLWDMSLEARGASLLDELLAAANHRPALKAVIAETSRSSWRFETSAVDAVLDDYGIDRSKVPAELVAAAIQGVARLVLQDERLGSAIDRRAVVGAVDRLIGAGEDRRAAQRSAPSERHDG